MSVSVSREPARIAGMFDDIAWRYDLLNHLLSAGLDRRWRRRAIRELRLTGREALLDVCTGTADLAIEAAAGTCGLARHVVGVDFAGAMLALGRAKVARRSLAGRVVLARGDAMRLPFRDETFDAATMAFGIRNVADPGAGIRELARVLRPGGRVAILEFGMPDLPGVAAVYRWYFRAVLPRIGRALSRHPDAYAYLPASVEAFPAGEAFLAGLRQADFHGCRLIRLALGAVCLYVAERG